MRAAMSQRLQAAPHRSHPSKHVAKVSRRHDAAVVGQDLVALMDRLGFTPDDMFAAARIGSRRRLGAQGVATLDRRGLSRLFEAIVIEAERQSCRTSRTVPALPEHGFQMLCFALIACPTLREAIGTASRFFEVFTAGATAVGICEGESRCRFFMNSITDQPGSLHNCLVTTAGLHSFAQLFSWLIGHDLDLSDVTVRHAPAVSNIWVSGLLAGRPQPSQESNGFSFGSAALNSRVVRSYAELVELIQFFPFDLMPPDYDSWLLAERVHAFYLASLHRRDPARLPAIAAAFNVTLTTLRRRLAEENRSFQGIKDNCRLEMAKMLLGESAATLAEIADQLGFTDVANFRRSFLRWTGTSPTRFRADAIGERPFAGNDRFVDKNDLAHGPPPA